MQLSLLQHHRAQRRQAAGCTKAGGKCLQGISPKLALQPAKSPETWHAFTDFTFAVRRRVQPVIIAMAVESPEEHKAFLSSPGPDLQRNIL